MASLSIVPMRESEAPERALPSSAHLFSPSRPSTFRTPASPGPTHGMRSPSASTAAGMQVLNSIASRRRGSATAGPLSPKHGQTSASATATVTGPRVAFAYPRSPSNGCGPAASPVVRSPGRGRYIGSSGAVRFETSGYSEVGAGAGEDDDVAGVDEEDDNGTVPQSPRKRPRGPAGRAVVQRKPSVTLMPAFGSNTIYGRQRDPEEGAGVSPGAGRGSRKPRSASHSVESRPTFVARNILTGYQRVESPSAANPAIPSAGTLRMPFGTDASDVDAANGLMSMLGSAPASFNPARNAGPPLAAVRSPTLDAPGHHLRAPKPRAASFAAILNSTTGVGPRIASPTRARRFQPSTGALSPSSAKRKIPGSLAREEHASVCATSSSSSSDEDNLKASAAASASDEDQQAAEAILFLAASPSPAIAHSSPAKASLARATTTTSANSKIGRVLFDEMTDEGDPARRALRANPYSAVPSSVVAQQKRFAVGDSPLQQPPINNTSPSSDRFSRALPVPLTVETAPSVSLTSEEDQDTSAMPLTAPLEPGMDETDGVSLPEPTQLLSPPDSDHSKP